MRHSMLIFIIVLTIFGATACGYTDKFQKSDYDFGSQEANDPKNGGPTLYGSTTGNPAQHRNTSLQYSAELSRAASSVNGVGNAVVFVTDKNIYAAITVDNTAAGTKNKGNVDEQISSGRTQSTKKLEALEWNKADVARPYNSDTTVHSPELLSAEFKQAIAKKLREAEPSKEEVHISANMDFVNQMTDIAQQAWLGRGLEPYVSQFNEIVQAQFNSPDSKLPALDAPRPYLSP